MKTQDARDRLISEVAAGRSFADVGGLWGTVNEKVSTAHRCGATELTMVDVSVAGSTLWPAFEQRMRELQVDRYRCVIGDVTEAATLEEIGPVEVVHSSGVFYHMPEPISYIVALRELATEFVILTSAITKTVMIQGRRRLKVPRSSMLFIPALRGHEAEIVRKYWKRQGVEGGGITEDCEYRIDDFGPWWYLPTQEALRSVCETAGFRVESQEPTWHGNASTLLLSKARGH